MAPRPTAARRRAGAAADAERSWAACRAPRIRSTRRRRRAAAVRSCGSPRKGLGVGPNPNGPNPLRRRTTDDNINSFQYLPSIVTRRWRASLDVPDRRAAPRADAAAARADAPVERARPRRPARRCAPDGPIKHVFYIVTREPHLRPGAGRRRARRRRPEADAVRRPGHAQRARARPALPAARPRLRELRGVDRRALLDGAAQGVRLRRQELAPELRRPRPAVRLRRLRGHLAGQAASCSTRPSAGHLAASTTARRSPGVVPLFPTRTARPRTRSRSQRKFAKSDLGADRTRRLLPERRLRSARTRSPGQRGRSTRRRRPARPPARSRASTASGTKFTRRSRPNTVPAFNYLVAAERPHRGLDAGRAHAARDGRRQRLRRSGRSST